MPREASRKGPRPSRKGELHGSSPSDDDVTATRILAAEPASLEATKTQHWWTDRETTTRSFPGAVSRVVVVGAFADLGHCSLSVETQCPTA